MFNKKGKAYLYGLCAILVAAPLSAAYQNTADGTDIDSLGGDTVLSYDISGSTFTESSAVTASTTVVQNGGITLNSATWLTPAVNSLIAGTGASYTFSIVNSGNFTETVTLGTSALAGGFSGAWTNLLSSNSENISREGIYNGSLAVTADAGASDGSVGSLTVDFNGTAGTGTYGTYAGSNSYNYGGEQAIAVPLSFIVSAPDISVTKSVVVNAPAAYIANGGGVNDPVPGATLVYTIEYENDGSAAASNVTIVDTIVTNTEFATATGGTSIDYDSGSGWSGVAPAAPVDPTVTDVRWTIGTIGIGASGTITLEVVIQ